MELNKIKIAMLQMSSIIGNVEENIKKIRMLAYNLPNDVDVLIMPEVWSVGWNCNYFVESAKYQKNIENFLSNLARSKNINIIAGSIITKSADKYYNTCSVYDRQGKLIASYNKNHLYSYYGCNEGTYITPGANLVMANIDGVKFGLSICYDIRFPEIYREYAKNGADILVNCAAWGSKKSLQWETMTRSRAIENQCFMVALTQTGKISEFESNLGESRIIDYNGNDIVSIIKDEGIIFTNIELEKMYTFRQKASTLNDIHDNYEVIVCEK